ncbi:hypothetical protein GBV73_03085 [Thermococcus sp. 101 C5]|jgi:hypothetical protein|uniref:hypothetical protein n=1 Tax=Thermococcus TaxID=2263 RepID=UPI0005B2593F|nr:MULTISPECIES: hypothetical protein [Thermococcus]MCA6213260.1 hypothetical protein [Thermococcus bergensis]MPW38687.1 hypothetical protein [Thermococcus sp. 101 C5]
MPLELLKRHYGDNLLAVAQVRDTLLVILKEGDKVELLADAAESIFEPLAEKGYDVMLWLSDSIDTLHPEVFGDMDDFRVLYDPEDFLSPHLSKLLEMKGALPTLKNLDKMLIKEVVE